MHDYPKNLAIIMDGNRRWASLRGLSAINGHKKGAEKLKDIITKCNILNVEELSVFAFSTENWSRVPSEVSALIGLIERYLKSEIEGMYKNNLVFNVIGDKKVFKKSLVDMINYAEKITSNNSGMKLNIALNYGGRQDIVEACKNIAEKINTSELKANELNEKIVFNNLISSKVNNVDLMIRTSGEKRISNFLPWQLSYSEFYFSESMWPDFDEKELENAFKSFSLRQRRFGSSIKNT